MNGAAASTRGCSCTRASTDCQSSSGPTADPDGRSLLRIAAEDDDDTREVFGEYHAAGAVNGVYMLRRGPWKYVHYANMPAQLFNLAEDPQELRDLADDPAHRATRDAFEARLRARLDPEAVDRWAKARQLEIVDRHGGAEAILSRGSMGASPPPGTRFAGHRTS